MVCAAAGSVEILRDFANEVVEVVAHYKLTITDAFSEQYKIITRKRYNPIESAWISPAVALEPYF